MARDSNYPNLFHFEGKKVVIIGASGFIGSHLADSLLQHGFYVHAISRTFPGLLTEFAISHPFFTCHVVDITNPSNLQDILNGADFVVHLASGCLPQNSNEFPHNDVQVNLLGSLNVLDNCVAADVKRLIFISSGGTVYGTPAYVPIDELHPTDPMCSYGINKLAIEKYLALYRSLHNLESLVLRLSNPYGERQRLNSSQGVVPVFLGRVLRGESLVVWGDGTIVRDFLYISDVIDAIFCSFNYLGDHTIFNIGSGEGTSINELIHIIEDVSQKKIKVNYQPHRSFDVPTNVLSIDRAVNHLHWSPRVSACDGIQMFYQYLVGS